MGLASCGGEAPELLTVDWRLELRPMEGGSYESLSVFANVHDFDGSGDLESLTISQDSSGLSWTLDDTNWLLRKEGSDSWFGAGDLAMADRSSLPRGDYRVVATDLSGQRAEKTFSLAGDASKPGLPGLSIAGKLAKIDSAWPETVFLAYDAAGSLIQSKQVNMGDKDLASLLSPSSAARAASIAIYGYDPQRQCGAFSWKMKL
jgi:hypothetical protein